MTVEDLSIGEELPGGRVYAGLSPRTGRPMYLRSEPLVGDIIGVIEGLTRDETEAAMKNLAPLGWRGLTRDELNDKAEGALRDLAHGAVRWADESDSDPFRQRRLTAVFTRSHDPAMAGTERGQYAGEQVRTGEQHDPFKRGGPG
jgi:hypothetical protein